MTDNDADSFAALLLQHRRLIEGSAISEEVARERGYCSVEKKTELASLGFGRSQQLVPALLSPVHGVAGGIVNYQIRPDQPRINANSGKPIKYETVGGSRMVLDVPPSARHWLREPQRPLFITEGSRKADSGVSRGLCCIALLGVWNFRGTNEYGGKTALGDWESIALNGRKVYIVFDSDVMEKAAVRSALARLKAFLETRDATVLLIYLPTGEGGSKVGLDDFFAAGHSVDELLQLATSELRDSVEGHDKSGPYAETERGLVYHKETASGTNTVPLANFVAKIVSDVVEDDGAETRRVFGVEARLAGPGQPTVYGAVPVANFMAMRWPVEQLGARATVLPGMTEHCRAAIQTLSTDIRERRVYAYTGWVRIDGQWFYLHADGAISVHGSVDLEVKLPPALSGFVLPEPADSEVRIHAVSASLGALEVAPLEVTAPIIGSVWAAVSGEADCAVHLAGPTGAGKSQLAALAQQHFGASFDSQHLPANWSSMANANEALAHSAKDAVLVIDDFCPTGTVQDSARLNRDADRLFRGQGNHSGRARMRADGSLRPDKPPRCLILSTGEDSPKGHSLRARAMIVEVGPESVDWAKLTECQKDARQGFYAQTMSTHLQRLASRYEAVQARERGELAALRDKAAQCLSGHKRTPGIVARLQRGWNYFFATAVEVGALTPEEAETFRQRIWSALVNAAKRQRDQHETQEPAARFAELLGAAIASGRAHLRSMGGQVPNADYDKPDGSLDFGTYPPPSAFGWRHDGDDWRSQGECVGWVEGEAMYLQPASAYTAVQRMGQASGEPLPVSEPTLWKRMRERGLLASTDDKRQTLKVRRTIDGCRKNVIHVNTSLLLDDPGGDTPPDQTDHGHVKDSSNGGDEAAGRDYGAGGWFDGRAYAADAVSASTTDSATSGDVVESVSGHESRHGASARVVPTQSEDWSGDEANWTGNPTDSPTSMDDHVAPETSWEEFAF